VIPVTLGTGGRVGFFFRQRLSVDACIEFLILIVMAGAAFYRSQCFGMREFLDIRIRMTAGASRLLVNGPVKFLQIDIKGNGLAFSLFRQLFIRMTLHAIFIRSGERKGGDNEGAENGEQPSDGSFHSMELYTHEVSPFLGIVKNFSLSVPARIPPL
jgi:hypothetical protein